MAQNRVIQDRRRLSRISMQMECRFKSDDHEYGALMLDLSQGGALLSSALLPPQESFSDTKDVTASSNEPVPIQESRISLTLEAEGLRKPMTLEGTIKRSAVGMSEYGKVAQFGVEFENTPLELLRLISVMSRRKPTSGVSPTQVECQYKLNNEEYTARILDLSSEGALLHSAVIPDTENKISITFRADGLNMPVTLEGRVTRSAAAGDGDEGQFGVEFENASSPEIAGLIKALTAQKK